MKKSRTPYQAAPQNVDVVVTKEGIGPVLAVSCKGAIGAFRNNTTSGSCTRLPISGG